MLSYAEEVYRLGNFKCSSLLIEFCKCLIFRLKACACMAYTSSLRAKMWSGPICFGIQTVIHYANGSLSLLCAGDAENYKQSRFSSLVHKKGRFRGWGRKNEPAVHEKGCFCGQGPGYLLYLHDLNENTN